MRTGARTFLVVLALLVTAGCSGNRDQLLADLQSPRPEVRALAVKKLADESRPDDLALFTRAAKDLASIVRGEAAAALGKSQDPRVVDLLGELLEDSDVDVQGKAAMALAQVKNDKAKAYLTLQYGRRGRQTRQVIVQALKQANVPGAMAEVVAAESKAIWERNLLALTEGSLPERVGAAEELGKSGRPEAFNRLMPLVRDSQVILAAAAVRGLGDLGDKRAVAAILPLLDESFPDLRESAITALMRLQEPQAIPRLQAVAVEKSSVSPLAIDALLDLPRQPETDAALCAIALDAVTTEAIPVARAMRDRGGCPLETINDRLSRPASAASGLQAVIGLGPAAKDALPKVLPYLTQGDATLRALAVDAAAAIGDASAAPALQKAFEQELASVQPLRQDWVTQALPERYGPGFDPSQPPPPGDSAEKQKQKGDKHANLMSRVKALNAAKARSLGRPVVQQRVPTELFDDVESSRLEPLAGLLRALGSVKAPGALALLKGFAGDSSVTLRTAALVGLTRLGPEGVALAKNGLFEAERDLLKALAQALAEQGDAGQSALVELLPQISGEKLVLLEALNRSGAPASSAEVLEKVVSEGGPEAVLAASLLGRMKAKTAVPVLVKALEDPSSVGRRELLTALGEIGDSSAAELVVRDLYHDLPEIRAAAAGALARMGTGAQADALDALKSDYYRRVREAAVTALAKTTTAAEGAR
ncbi:HEAT repeat domain-containing protein [Vitiosangium sp. GDMCC 1.1324]|uniref:HEAT repeat domain-containing protein n=1 Tax=Vitiosangium sp. (strain GDMCC 1.1324) TaxID=2138576 RepID=UPI000D383359|nr:HEAT repeat domain-containing protein [Vitiosangium sp. GDMCC 1.1324]PTL85792.1 PBS lyase [Vitiosangium sp. GDMCC 1.1324]